MCFKCLRAAKRLGHKPLTRGQIKFFARQFNTPVVSFPEGGPLYQPIPFFNKRGINVAIEAYLYQIHRKQTNRKHYRRKKEKYDPRKHN